MPLSIQRLTAALLTSILVVGIAPAGALAVDWSKARKVAVIAVEYAFRPADLRFRVGTAYRLHLENKGKETHEFTAPDFFKAIDMRNADITGRDHIEIVIRPGERKDLYFIPKQAGSYDLRCSDHDWAGMVGHITVTQ